MENFLRYFFGTPQRMLITIGVIFVIYRLILYDETVAWCEKIKCFLLTEIVPLFLILLALVYIWGRIKGAGKKKK